MWQNFDNNREDLSVMLLKCVVHCMEIVVYCCSERLRKYYINPGKGTYYSICQGAIHQLVGKRSLCSAFNRVQQIATIQFMLA